MGFTGRQIALRENATSETKRTPKTDLDQEYLSPQNTSIYQLEPSN
jgi:hypothetical protein